MRLVKWLAQAGVASRRKVEELIAAGEVTVDGETVTNPATDVSEVAVIAVAGKPVEVERRETYLLHKPVGVVSTAKDTHGRQTVTDLVPSDVRLYPVGRLDADSSGLILLTNDGELANRLTHPRYEVPKTYRVKVRGRITDAAVRRLEKSVQLEDGPTAPAEVRVRERGAASEFDITIHEGRNRQVRRMGEVVGFPVTKLVRIKFGPLGLEDLKPGISRKLTAAELDALRNASAGR